MPVTREDMQEYYANIRARLCTSERAQDGMRQLLSTSPRHGGLDLCARRATALVRLHRDAARVDAQARPFRSAGTGRHAGETRCARARSAVLTLRQMPPIPPS
ncbi:hypothetical protein ACWDUL_16965 [Nocardia niigatensis]